MTKHGNNPDWIVRYHPAVIQKDIIALDKVAKRRVGPAIERKLLTNPLLFGSPLHGVLRRLFKLRVGDWRIVYEITPPYIDVLHIAHRKDVYSKAAKRSENLHR